MSHAIEMSHLDTLFLLRNAGNHGSLAPGYHQYSNATAGLAILPLPLHIVASRLRRGAETRTVCAQALKVAMEDALVLRLERMENLETHSNGNLNNFRTQHCFIEFSSVMIKFSTIELKCFDFSILVNQERN
jgi:hypothetical protein